MVFPICYTPHRLSLVDKSDDDRLLENSPNVLLLTYLLYRLDGRTGEIHAVRAARLAPYHLAQSLIGVSRVHQHHVRALLPILPHEVVHEEGLAASAGTQHEFVSVGRDALFHRQVGNVEVQRFSREPVRHLDAEG